MVEKLMFGNGIHTLTLGGSLHLLTLETGKEVEGQRTAPWLPLMGSSKLECELSTLVLGLIPSHVSPTGCRVPLAGD